MGNSLLDFVMGLVRDPGAAARYAVDPAGALADAQLTGVTIADVNNLIPVVADSLAAATPDFGAAAAADPGNVWTSQAAVAAFDAFDIHPPITAEVHQPAVELQPAERPEAQPPGEARLDDPPVPAIGETPVPQQMDDWADDAAWQHPHTDPQHPQIDPQAGHHPGDPSGLDLF